MAKKKIGYQELIELVDNLDVSDEELAKYFVLDQENSDAFKPSVIPNPKLVADSGLEGAFFINAFNKLSRRRRNRKYRRLINDGWKGIRIVAEGDSWFQYPLLLKDTIDHLCDPRQFQYAIYGLSEAGDLLSNIFEEDEISDALKQENPDLFLISGGGNDMVGNGRMATLVHEYKEGRKAEDYPNQRFNDFLNELESLYRRLFRRILTDHPHLKIFVHGYDHVIPQNGPWLGRPLANQGINSRVLQRKIVEVMIEKFNLKLESISNEFSGSVFHVDCRNLVGSKANWYDELHPRNDGYFKVAERFDEMIKIALSRSSDSATIMVEGANQHDGSHAPTVELAKMSKLDDQEFLDMVVKRAETVMGKKVSVPKNREERVQLEKQIDDHFERLHKEANFLPISFLEKGVERAHSVCRVSTDLTFGSGFMIATRDLIMTNNHVIPDEATARRSHAEFDYDEDDILYTVQLKPDDFFVTNSDLDYTIVACDSQQLPSSITPITLLYDPDTVTREERVNIIQHPRGRRKEIAIHENKVTYVYDIGLRYTADTQRGSSGSPVFNKEWNLVALHHAGFEGPNNTASNEGIRIKAIVDDLINRNNQESSSQLSKLIAAIKHEADEKPHVPKLSQTPTLSKQQSPSNSKSVTINLGDSIDEVTINFD